MNTIWDPRIPIHGVPMPDGLGERRLTPTAVFTEFAGFCCNLLSSCTSLRGCRGRIYAANKQHGIMTPWQIVNTQTLHVPPFLRRQYTQASPETGQTRICVRRSWSNHVKTILFARVAYLPKLTHLESVYGSNDPCLRCPMHAAIWATKSLVWLDVHLSCPVPGNTSSRSTPIGSIPVITHTDLYDIHGVVCTSHPASVEWTSIHPSN